MAGYLAPIRINGAGPTGGLLALGLANFGYSIHLYDPLNADQICSRSRAYALTQSSRRLLTLLGLWNELARRPDYENKFDLHSEGHKDEWGIQSLQVQGQANFQLDRHR
jgi:2-polyprenyl-6-methoxyphenol hydroxylase-like FAD-dependent oxidoreductase